MERSYLETPIFSLPRAQGTEQQPSWKVRNAVEGVQIFGGIGSGKTSGSGRTLALKYLKAGFGGLVLTVKPDEVDLWRSYCQETGRIDDLVIIKEGGEQKFNFLEYESKRNAGAISRNIHQVLKTVINAAEDRSGGGNKDRFWEDSLDMLLVNLIDLCLLAYDEVTVSKLYLIAASLPKNKRIDATKNNELDEKPPITAFELARDAALTKIEKEKQHTRRYNIISHFFETTYLNLADKTRSVIDFSLQSFLFGLLSEPVYSLFFSEQSTIVPDDCRAGKIILVNLPVKVYDKIGRDCQVMFKYIWQRAMERHVVNNNNSRIVFLWADEAQNFIHEHDADFQATARSSQVATVYLTQNLPNYYANMGGNKYIYKTQSFLGTLATKIFHANADIETNQYASKLIGGDDVVKKSQGFSNNMTDDTESVNFSTERQPLVHPEAFSTLENGGESNKMMVEAYIHFQGNVLPNNKNHSRLTFSQNYMP